MMLGQIYLMIFSREGRKQNGNLPKYKYGLSSKLHDLHASTSLEDKIRANKIKNLGQKSSVLPEKIHPKASFSLQKLGNYSQLQSSRTIASTKKKQSKSREILKFPAIKKNIINPETTNFKPTIDPQPFYQAKIFRAFHLRENTYMMNLARQHFLQVIEAIKIGKTLKQHQPQKQIKLSKKHPEFKTIFLDLDECLIHCDEDAKNYTVKLNFPVEGGAFIPAGIRVRPYCQEFIQELSTFSEIIIFTASAPSYANIVLDYLDPNKKIFSHRLYRQHCTLQDGFYTKDLRIVNRRAQDVALVDNSAFSFMTQPQFGIPILPFYHSAKDKQLITLLEYLKKLVKEADMRQKIRQTFLWDKFIKSDEDARKILIQNYGATFAH